MMRDVFSLPPVGAATVLTAALTAALGASVAAQQAFPLPQSAGNTTAVEDTAPFLLPMRCSQTRLLDRVGLLAALGANGYFAAWDMVALDPTSRFAFVTCETGTRAALFRYDLQTAAAAAVLVGNGGARTADPSGWAPNNDEFARLDPATWTPWNTVVTAEEVDGGRLFEVLNPLAAPGAFQIAWRSAVPSLKHEGLQFDAQGNLYCVDEIQSGSVYRFVPSSPGDLSSGQSFVLRVDAYASDPNARPAENWDSAHNQLTQRLGAATWIPLTDAAGNPLTQADPFEFVTATGGRDAADEVGATPYGRPEDVHLTTLANGNPCLFVALTTEHAVLAIELTGATTAVVRRAVDGQTPDLATGTAVGGLFESPDNLTVDAWGRLYVVEDALPGDVWQCVDDDGDGVADAVGRLASLGVAGAEPSGILFDPNDPYRLLMTVMHPASANDGLWSVQLRPYPGMGDPYLQLRSAVAPGAPAARVDAGPGQFVRLAGGGHVLTLAAEPRAAQLLGAPFVIALQPFVTAAGAPGFLPPLWVDPFQSLLVVRSGSLGPLPAAPPFGTNGVDLPVPAGLAGLSVMAQAIALAPGQLVASDGVEVVLLP